MAKRKNGEGTWGEKTVNGVKYKFYRDSNGKQFYGKTIKEINEKREKYKKKKKEQEIIINDNTIFTDYVLAYLKTKFLQLESTTYDTYEDVINGMLKNNPIGNIAISNINENNMRKYIDELSKMYAKASIEKLFNIVRPALEYAVEHKNLSSNPLKYVKLPTESNVAVKRKKIPFITKEDLDKLYTESKRVNTKGYNFGGMIGEPTYGNNAYAIILIGHTGLRVSEVIGLRWKNVDLENKKIYVKKVVVEVKNRDGSIDTKHTKKEKEPKSKASEREIPLSDIALEMIEFFHNQNPKHKPNDFVVINKNKKSPSRSNMQKTLDAMLARSQCSIEHCGLHGLRHGFGAILLSNGVDIKIVSKLLGHQSISTTYDIYIDFTKEQVQNAVVSVLNKK